MARALPLIALLLTAIPQHAQTRTAFRFLHKLDSFSAKDRAGKTWTLANLQGKTTYIYVWATWCAPCQTELPELQKLHQRLQSSADTQVLAISVDDDAAKLDAYIRDHQYSFPVIADYHLSDKNFPAGKLPAAFLVNRDATRTDRYVPPVPGTLAFILEDIAAAAK